MEQQTLSTLTAIASLLGAAGGLFAAAAAFRSAGTARKAANQAAAVEKRAQVRELSATANSIIAETIRIDDLANRCKLAYETLAVFSGGSGSSRIKMCIDSVEKKQREVGPIQTRAREISESWNEQRNQTEEVITELLAELDNNLIQIRRVKEGLLGELESIDDQNRTYREKTINRT